MRKTWIWNVIMNGYRCTVAADDERDAGGFARIAWDQLHPRVGLEPSAISKMERVDEIWVPE